MIGEFKKFITRGNVVDLAVGVIVGASFNKIVTSLVNDIITPIISFLTGLFSVGGFNLAEMSFTLREGAVLNLGAFITYVIDFLLTAFVVFIIVKGFNKLNETAGKLPISKIGGKKDEGEGDKT